jgi:hypothetical protein
MHEKPEVKNHVTLSLSAKISSNLIGGGKSGFLRTGQRGPLGGIMFAQPHSSR